jgi:hypothetical protein
MIAFVERCVGDYPFVFDLLTGAVVFVGDGKGVDAVIIHQAYSVGPSATISIGP